MDRGDMFRLSDALAVDVPGAQYAMRARPGWDGKYRPLSGMTGVFPTGIIGLVRKHMPFAVIDDHRKRPLVIPLDRNILRKPLRDYQFQCLQAVFAQDRGVLSGRGVIGMSVGGGKTPTGMAIALHIPGKCVVFLHRKDLLHQWLEEIKSFTGIDAAAIGDGAWDGRAEDPGTKFVIAMPQTVGKSTDEFKRCVADAKLFLLDEVHRSSGPAKWMAIAQLVPAYYRLGLTGTPETDNPANDLRLKGVTGNVIFKVGATTLATMGHLVPCKVFIHRVTNPAVFGDWHTVRRMLIEDNDGRNDGILKIIKEEVARHRRVLVICDTVRHAKTLSGMVLSEGINGRLIMGRTGSSDRTIARQDVKNGRLEVVCATGVWDEGINLPNLDVVIIAAGGKSSVRFLQRVGRALRIVPGKTEGTIHDFFDTGHRHVISHSMRRQEICKREKFTMVVGATFIGRPGQPPQSVVEDVEVHEVGAVEEESEE
jgi:superfamily II DNA or RNA helicase